MKASRCRFCHRQYYPNPRAARFKKLRKAQQSCGRKACRRARQRQNYRGWIVRNPGHRGERRIKIRAWAKAYPDYWCYYRANAPAYRQRECQRMVATRRTLRRVAKQITCARREAGPAK
jgi:hypothetical protein